MLSAPSSTSTSHQCLELLMNSVLLYVSLGRMTVALGTLEGALFGFTEKPFETEFKGTVYGQPFVLQSLLSLFLGVCEHLSLEDRQMACVCLLHLLYWQQIPSGVFRSPNTALVPSKIVCKVRVHCFLEFMVQYGMFAYGAIMVNCHSCNPRHVALNGMAVRPSHLHSLKQ